MSETPRNLNWLRGLKVDGIPEFGSRLHELVADLVTNQNLIAQQTNSSLNGVPAPPPSPQSVTVTPNAAGVHVSIVHSSPRSRGVEYAGEYADNPHMTNPFPFHMGPSREHDMAVGSQKLYYRVWSQYQTSPPSAPVYHGGAIPTPVTGGTATPLGLSQGSGTGAPGQPLQGYGSASFTGSAPPTRGTVQQGQPTPPPIASGGDT
jgi:hypothetical protein